mmetsp:Transcript_30353/g.48355  ORF Transcript_30353/g.48355 Transcript_30353/m.48355 type:complete len:556 (+) Transcript_30353:72-1739(+)
MGGHAYEPVGEPPTAASSRRGTRVRWAVFVVVSFLAAIILVSIAQRREAVQTDSELYFSSTLVKDLKHMKHTLGKVAHDLNRIQKKKYKKAVSKKPQDIPDAKDLSGTVSVWKYLYGSAMGSKLIAGTKSEFEESSLVESKLNVITLLIKKVENERADEWLVQLAIWFEVIAREWPEKHVKLSSKAEMELEKLLQNQLARAAKPKIAKNGTFEAGSNRQLQSNSKLPELTSGTSMEGAESVSNSRIPKTTTEASGTTASDGEANKELGLTGSLPKTTTDASKTTTSNGEGDTESSGDDRLPKTGIINKEVPKDNSSDDKGSSQSTTLENSKRIRDADMPIVSSTTNENKTEEASPINAGSVNAPNETAGDKRVKTGTAEDDQLTTTKPKIDPAAAPADLPTEEDLLAESVAIVVKVVKNLVEEGDIQGEGATKSIKSKLAYYEKIMKKKFKKKRMAHLLDTWKVLVIMLLSVHYSTPMFQEYNKAWARMHPFHNVAEVVYEKTSSKKELEMEEAMELLLILEKGCEKHPIISQFIEASLLKLLNDDKSKDSIDDR